MSRIQFLAIIGFIFCLVIGPFLDQVFNGKKVIRNSGDDKGTKGDWQLIDPSSPSVQESSTEDEEKDENESLTW